MRARACEPGCFDEPCEVAHLTIDVDEAVAPVDDGLDDGLLPLPKLVIVLEVARVRVLDEVDRLVKLVLFDRATGAALGVAEGLPADAKLERVDLGGKLATVRVDVVLGLVDADSLTVWVRLAHAACVGRTWCS